MAGWLDALPKYGSKSAVMAEGRKAIPAPKGLQPNLSSTKTGMVCRVDEGE